MLVLSRKRGETIVINDDTTVTVVALGGGKVRLGVDAPASVPIHRGEIASQLGNRSHILSRHEHEPA